MREQGRRESTKRVRDRSKVREGIVIDDRHLDCVIRLQTLTHISDFLSAVTPTTRNVLLAFDSYPSCTHVHKSLVAFVTVKVPKVYLSVIFRCQPCRSEQHR